LSEHSSDLEAAALGSTHAASRHRVASASVEASAARVERARQRHWRCRP